MLVKMVAALAAALLVPIAVTAQTVPPVASPSLTARVAGLIPIIDGAGDYDRFFAASFRTLIPRAQFDAISQQLKGAYGKPQRIVSTTPASARSATIVVGYERGTVTMAISVDADGAVDGLRITGTAAAAAADDSASKLAADFRALPGTAGFGIYELGDATPRAIAEERGTVAAPLGSAFKLWILAALADEVQHGTRHWDDVVPLAPASLPSGITQAWPAATPMTLQSLATLMISISDNTATDTLLAAVGRDRVGALALETDADPRSLPVLSTREAFVLKADPARAAAWGKADRNARAAMLADRSAWTGPIDAGVFAGKPVASETVEWFASPLAMARTLDRLRRADAVTRAILAVNPGTDASRFDYLGFKGGSEPGFITMNFLVRTKAGAWRAVTGNWHRPDGETATVTFLALMNRALDLVR